MINRVDTTAMRAAATDIEQMVHDYTQQVTALYTSGQELDKHWEGDASRAFKAQLGKDQPRFEKLSNVVKQYTETLRSNADKYDKEEERALEIQRINKKRTS